MFSTQVISGISGGVLGIAGLLLVMSTIRQRRVNWRIGIGAPLFGVGLFILVTDLPQYALGFSILATLAMAFAALLNIKQSADRENRDRRERLLNEIINWATNVFKDGALNDMMMLKGDIENARRLAAVNIEEWKDIKKQMTGKNQYISTIALNFDQNLRTDINKLVKNLEKYLEELTTPRKAPKQGEIPIAAAKLKVYKSANIVIEEAAKTMAKDIS